LAVTDEAIEKIKAMITSGALRAGDRLPREADLAADLGLSRSSLREGCARCPWSTSWTCGAATGRT
jgi:DNA-binding FadR family transcriptional regulator